ncbi:hypothetical protein [Paenibacillus gansuensis]|uniref:Lipoprotein n=1 Tax=Paenibacillus gansuensis TaxID=306542 RepID=A0ABW5P8W9_9BACL
MNNKRMAAAALCAVLAIGLAGCGSNDPDVVDTPQGNVSESGNNPGVDAGSSDTTSGSGNSGKTNDDTGNTEGNADRTGDTAD